MVESDDFRRDRPFHDGGDLLDDIDEIAAGLVDQRRVGRDAVEKASGRERSDLRNLGSVGEKLHGLLRSRLWWIWGRIAGAIRRVTRFGPHQGEAVERACKAEARWRRAGDHAGAPR